MTTGLPPTNPPITPSSNNAGPAGSNDFSSNLQQISWRGLIMPCVSFKENGSQQLAVHEYPNLDGARVEPVGRNPMQFSVRAVFTNNVYPAINETWPAGKLYPDVFNRLMSLLYNDAHMESGIFQHPDKPAFNCRIVSWDYGYTGDAPRDGAFVDFTLIETIKEKAAPIQIPSGIPELNIPFVQDALNNPPFAPPGLNLGQFLQQVSTAVAQITAYPSTVITGLQSQLASLNASTQSIAASLITAIPQTIATSRVVAQQTSNSFQYGSLLNAYNQASNTNFGTNSNASTISGTSGLSGNTALITDPQSLQAVYQAAFALNNTTSGHAGIFLSKTAKLMTALIYYYNSLNNVTTASVKLGLELLLGQIQIAQEVLANNANGQTIRQYVVPQNISLISLSSYLNQDLDTFLSLNPFVTPYYYVAAQTQVNFIQS